MPAIVAEGFTTDKFAGLRATFEGNLASGADVGASVSVRIADETVVDLWGGSADAHRTRPWVRDTIVNVYSTTKTMTALTALLLADRGVIDFEAPVAKYWPEFAANGKADIKVKHLMSHSSGLSGWKETVTKQDLYDWDRAVELLAAQAPFWPPGTASGYHAVTMGFLVGEVVRRVTGKTMGTVFREEIAGPLGADFHIGLPASEDARVAELIPPPPGGNLDDNLDALNEIQKNWIVNPLFRVEDSKTRAWRGAEMGASNGQGNARSIALVHTILANGGVAKGKRFMSEAGCRKALELQIDGTDVILAMPIRFGLGFGLAGGLMPFPNQSTMFWGGYGGSIAIIDMENRMSFGYAMNKMAGTTVGDLRALGLAMAAWQSLGAM
ncbi:MAG TPA: serine hydrolase domain-containing protein [Rhizomicrobium sp.]|jgi:CubicO group peptidase (beta-lactamase class C family)|nr:serine hydrolase domain-containing protein [Rhizomicrobium sp.]